MHPPEFWNSDTLAARALSPLGALYGFATELKRNFASPYRAKARVLCVGNLSVGGTGKTPLCIALAHMLIARKERVVFLTRGYGGKLRGPVQVDTHRHDARLPSRPIQFDRRDTSCPYGARYVLLVATTAFQLVARY